MKFQFLIEGLKNKTFLIGLLIILIMIIMAVLAGFITNYLYDEIDISRALMKPSSQHLFGTDQLGRDLFTRVVYGARIALRVGFIAVVIETFIGVTFGLLAGYYGGKIEKVISFVTDLTWAMPPIILALAIVTMLGPSIDNVIIAIAVVSWAQFTRIVRAKTQSIKSLPYVEAARAFGENDFSIIIRYILPNIVPSIIIISTLALPSAIMSTTALGFLGLGAQPPAPDWGVILSEGITYMNKAPWISIFPGIAIVSIVVGFNLLGEGLRDVLDPRLKV